VKSLLKQLVMELYCAGWIPAGVATSIFNRFKLRGE